MTKVTGNKSGHSGQCYHGQPQCSGEYWCVPGRLCWRHTKQFWELPDNPLTHLQPSLASHPLTTGLYSSKNGYFVPFFLRVENAKGTRAPPYLSSFDCINRVRVQDFLSRVYMHPWISALPSNHWGIVWCFLFNNFIGFCYSGVERELC